MGRERTRQGKYILFYLACIIIFLFWGCIPVRQYSKDVKRVQLEQALHRTERHIEKKEFKIALKKYKDILDKFPQAREELLFRIGLIYAHPENPEKNYKKSLQYFQMLLEEFPKSELRYQTKMWILILQELLKKDEIIKKETNEIQKQKKTNAMLRKQIDTLKKENRLKDKKIIELHKQIEKLKEIDLTIEEKKRKTLP